MATLSSHHSDLTATQRRGLILAIVGLLLYLAHPVLRLTGLTQTTGPQYGFMLVSPYAAGGLVWGAYILRMGTQRPLTPMRALWIPVLVITMFAVLDLFAQGMLINLWEHIHRPWSRLHLRILAGNVPMLVMMAGSTYAVLGAAVSTKRLRSVLPALGLILLVVWFVAQDAYQPSPVFAVTLFGIVPFVIGYWATAPPED